MFPAMKLFFLLFAVACASSPSPSPTPTALPPEPSARNPETYIAEVVAKLQKSWDAAKSYQAEFKQVVLSKRMGTRDETEGVLYVAKPDRLRWETRTDGSTQILSGKKLTNIQENKRRKSRTVDIYKDVRKVTGGTPLNFLSGKSKFKEIYNIKMLSETPEMVELKLVPKREGQETLIAEVDKSSYFLRSLTTENTESRVRTEFSNIKTNVKLDSKLFEFKPGQQDVVHEE